MHDAKERINPIFEAVRKSQALESSLIVRIADEVSIVCTYKVPPVAIIGKHLLLYSMHHGERRSPPSYIAYMGGWQCTLSVSISRRRRPIAR